jgi:hypothetical protein
MIDLLMEGLEVWAFVKGVQRDRDWFVNSPGPFSKAQFAANATASADWERRQLMRRAITRIKEGRPNEAIGLLEGLRTHVPEGEERKLLDTLIQNLKTDAPVENSRPDHPADAKS